MIMLIGQILGCLIVAAGIGGAVGWLLRNVSASPLTQQFMGCHRHAAPQRTDAGEGAV